MGVSVDVAGHENLLESLESYVKGELLEGDNAYHCSKCNRKVRGLFEREPGPPLLVAQRMQGTSRCV